MNTPKIRLEAYKANAAKMAARYPQSAHYADWRNCRYPKPVILIGRNQIHVNHKEREIYADSFDCLPLYLQGDAHDFARIGHTGWYTDSGDYPDGVLKGAVLAFRNPHETNNDDGSHVFYLSATYHSDWDGVTVYLDQIHDTKRDAALYADECARVQAEQCREDDEIYQREQRAIEAREELHALNKNTLQLIREIKTARQSFTPAICQALTGALKTALRQRAELFETIQAGA